MWEVRLDLIEDWLDEQDMETKAHIVVALRRLAEKGPALGRPLVDTLSNTRLSNLKELRPASEGRTEIRILFAFDPKRQAVMLFAGDKSKGGRREKWTNWYKKAIPIAEKQYELWLKGLIGGEDGTETDA